jgi:hypothetical protein
MIRTMEKQASQPTEIVVRVIAKDGKFLGDDIGGALVTLRDIQTGELLASGPTSGGSGPVEVMCQARQRGTAIPTGSGADGASAFKVTLDLEKARLIEFSAVGPLAAQGSENRVSATQWVYPGRNLNQGDGLLLEIPGLVVQIVEPPTHFLPQVAPPRITIRANVTMMCGCPIGAKPLCGSSAPSPWRPNEFEVTADIIGPGTRVSVQMAFDVNAPGNAPSQFLAYYQAKGAGIYDITVCAYQRKNGNTGVARATVILP